MASALGSTFGSYLVSGIINQRLTVSDYILFSTGHITWEGETKTISFGILNHVFTFEDKDMMNGLDKHQD